MSILPHFEIGNVLNRKSVCTSRLLGPKQPKGLDEGGAILPLALFTNRTPLFLFAPIRLGKWLEQIERR